MKSDRGEITTIDPYIQVQPEDVREALAELRETIRRVAPEGTERIRYRMPTFDYFGNLVHFATFKNHIGFYPTPSGIEPFKDELQQIVTTPLGDHGLDQDPSG